MTLENRIMPLKEIIPKVIFWLKPMGKDFCNEKYRSNDNICTLNYCYVHTGVDCKYLSNNRCSYDKNNFWR